MAKTLAEVEHQALQLSDHFDMPELLLDLHGVGRVKMKVKRLLDG